MFRRRFPPQNTYWTPFRSLRSFPNQNPTSYPNPIPIRRPVCHLPCGKSGRFYLSNDRERRRDRQEGTDKRSTGPPLGFEDRRFGGTTTDEKEEGAISRATNTIHVSNVATLVNGDDFRKSCEVYGEVERINYLKSYRFPDSMVCFVRYKRESEANIAQKRLGGTRRFGRVWRVNWARKDLQQLQESRKVNHTGNTWEEDKRKNEQAVRIIGEQNDEVIDLMSRSWMLVMERKKSMEDIRQIIEGHGLMEVSLIQWGLYGVIAVCKNENIMSGWIKKMDDMKKHFIIVEKVDSSEKRQGRYCWIEVKGIPIQTWSIGTMMNVANKWGRLLALDVETDMAYRMDIARLFIETQEIGKIDTTSEIWFQNKEFKILVQEVDRHDEVDVRLCQLSKLGKQSEQLDPVQEYSTRVGSGIFEDCNDNIHVVGDLADKAVQTKSKTDYERVTGICQEEDIHQENGSPETEGFGDTQVMETPPVHVSGDNRTPIFKPKSAESKRGGEKEKSNEVGNCLVGEKVKNTTGCSCCVNFYRRMNQEGGEEEIEKELEDRLCKDMDETSKVANMRRYGNIKLRTPKRKGPCIPRKGIFMRENKITKSKGRRGRKKQKKDKGNYELRDSTSESIDFVNEGLDLCEELGLRVKCNSAKRLQFEKFLVGSTREDDQGQGGGQQ